MTSSTPAVPDPNAPAPSDRLWLRSELMGTQVITRDTGRRLGVVGEVVVDIDRREVVALGLRDNPLTRFLPGLPRWMPLERIRQVGDVILVDSADSLQEGFDPDRYSKVINCQVISEAGAMLGRVLGFSFDVETGELTTLVIGALGVPLLGEGVLSTWELPVGEIVSSGTDRIIVYEGAEDKLKQLGTGLLEKLGIGGGGWEQEERERYRSSSVPAENQLPAGQPSLAEQRRIQPASSRSFQPEQEFDYVELEERRDRAPLRQRRYLDDDEDNRFERYRSADDARPGPLERQAYRREVDAGGPDGPEQRLQTRPAERFREPERPIEPQDSRDRYGSIEPQDRLPLAGFEEQTDRLGDRPADRRGDREEPNPYQRRNPGVPNFKTASDWERSERPGDRPSQAPVDVEAEVLEDPW